MSAHEGPGAGQPFRGAGGLLRAGALLVAAIVTHYDGQGVLRDGYGPGPHSELNRAVCAISPTGPRLLAGTLTGLGDAPVPWAA